MSRLAANAGPLSDRAHSGLRRGRIDSSLHLPQQRLNGRQAAPKLIPIRIFEIETGVALREVALGQFFDQ